MQFFVCLGSALLVHILLLWQSPKVNVAFLQATPAPRIAMQFVTPVKPKTAATPTRAVTASSAAPVSQFAGKKHQAQKKQKNVVKQAKKAKVVKKPVKKLITKAKPPTKIKPKTEPKTEPKIQPKVQPKVQPKIQPKSSDKTQQVAQKFGAPKVAKQASQANRVMQVNTLPLFKAPRPALSYPLSAKRKGQQGVSVIQIEIDRQGAIRQLRLIKSSGFSSLDSAALGNVKQWQFHPVIHNNQAVAARFNVPITFSLRS